MTRALVITAKALNSTCQFKVLLALVMTARSTCIPGNHEMLAELEFMKNSASEWLTVLLESLTAQYFNLSQRNKCIVILNL